MLIGVSRDNVISRNSMSDEKVLLFCVTERKKSGFQFTKYGRLPVKGTGLTGCSGGLRGVAFLQALGVATGILASRCHKSQQHDPDRSEI